MLAILVLERRIHYLLVLIVYMNGITKTMPLDACVDGNVSDLSQLVGDEYDQFSKFFQI